MKINFTKTLILFVFASLFLFTSCRHRDQKMIARGNIEFEKKNFNQAIQYYQKALDYNPNSEDAYYNIALCKSFLNNDTGAINDYNNAAIINPKGNVNIYIKRGILYYNIKKYKEALSDFKIAIELNPSNYNLVIYICECYRNLGKFDEALKEINNFIGANPKKAFAYCEKGYLEIEMKKFQEALDDLQKGLAIDSTDAILYSNKSQAEFELKDIDNAIKDVEKSVLLNPKNSYAYYIRAKIHLDKKEKDNACQDLNKALELDFTKNFGNDVQELINQNCK